LKNKILWLGLSVLITAAMLLASCNTSTTTATTTTSQPATSTTTTTTVKSSTTTSTSTSVPVSTSSASTTGKWWDTLGTPQYGGTITLSIPQDIGSFDPYYGGGYTITPAWMEKVVGPMWTVDPKVFNYSMLFVPSDYVGGYLAQSWELTDASTYIVHLRQGVHWQNIPPANGREFTSADVVWSYSHQFGLGSFTTHAPFSATYTVFQNLSSLTAPDKYTVIFKWKTSNPEYIIEAMDPTDSEQSIANQEATAQYGDLKDWHHVVGTGPFMLTDYVTGSSATLVRNPNYWGYDEHFPKNQLPYIDSLKYLIIPDVATTLAALRTGKIDAMDNIGLTDSNNLKKTNPELVSLTYATSNQPTIDPRVDVAPFKDINVRIAMQHALDLPTITSSYYGGTCSPLPLTLTSYAMTGWGYPYDQWPQSLKDSYSYNPTLAKQMLAAAGFPNGFKTDIVAQNTVDMDLLQVVKSYFAAVGITMDIRPMAAADWTAYVMRGHNQDALAQRQAGGLGLNYAFIRQLSRYQTGYMTNWLMVADPTYDAFYTQAVAASSIDQLKQIVHDANKYVAEQHWSISLVQCNLFTFNEPWLKGYAGQSFTIGGGNAGPMFAGYFLSRFWIDQKLKKSMGH